MPFDIWLDNFFFLGFYGTANIGENLKRVEELDSEIGSWR